jgi:hypothetical protein
MKHGTTSVRSATKYFGVFLAAVLLMPKAGHCGPDALTSDPSHSTTTSNSDLSSVANPPRSSPSPGNWVNVTSNLAGMSSECGNVSYVSAKPNEDLMIAGIAQRGLWGSRDGGVSWHQLGSGSGSVAIINRPGSIVYDPVRPDVFWESGIYNGNGAYRTDNNGGVFRPLGSVRHNDAISVDFTDPNRQTLLLGGHEQKQTLYRSQDGGSTWVNVGAKLPAGTGFSNQPLVANAKTFLVGSLSSWGGGSQGIYQSDDSGATWSLVSSQGGGAQPLVASDGSIYWPSGDGSLVRGTRDGSNWTWKQTVVSGILVSVPPIELPDGRIVSLSSQYVMISSDHGVSWESFGAKLPFTPTGISYSKFDNSFYIWHFDCGNAVLSDAIMKIWL